MSNIIENEIDTSDDDIDYKSYMVVNEFIPKKFDANFFYKIDKKNIFIKDNLDDAEKKEILDEKNDYFNIPNNIKEELMSILYDKFYMNKNSDPFIMSKKLSNEFFKLEKYNKDKLEKSIDFLYNKFQDINDRNLFTFDKESIYNMGYILFSSYHKFKEYKIIDNKSLTKNIKNSIKDGIDVIENYNNYNKKHKRKTEKQNKIEYWENHSYNYYLPGIFIFLMNIFKNKTIIEIEIDALSNIKEQLNFFTMCLINLDYILPKTIVHIKLNLINKRLQCKLYSKYYYDLINDIEKLHGEKKKFFLNNNLNNYNDIYQKKWNFEAGLLLKKYQPIDFNSKETKKINNTKNNNNNKIQKNKARNSDFNQLNYLKFKKLNKTINISKNKDLLASINNLTSDQISNDDSLNDMTTNQSSQDSRIIKNLNKSLRERKKSKLFSLLSLFPNNQKKKQSSKCCEDLSLSCMLTHKINEDEENLDLNLYNNIYKNNNKKFYEIVNDHIYIFSGIFIAFNTIKNLNIFNSIDLVMNDSYSREFIKILQKEIIKNSIKNDDINQKIIEVDKHSKDLLDSVKYFDLIDIISEKILNFNSINLEINILDYISFKKILFLLNNNKNLEILNLAFFSSDITYFLPSLYKIFYKTMNRSLNHSYFMDNVENKLLDLLYINFADSLQNLFYVIKNKNIKTFGFNFDIPPIMINHQNYTITILKFIINIILLIAKSENKTEKLIILSPLLKLDGRNYSFVNEIFDTLKIKNLEEMSFQIQLYKIINIKNIIGESLIILNIGDCDVFTFESLINYLTSYNFCLKSKLSKISISLMKIYTKLAMMLFKLLYKIFSIKIRQLIQMNIYTNLTINDSKEYGNFLNIFRNNWISSVKLTLNSKSKCICNYPLDETNNKIYFFVPYCLENYLLQINEETDKRNSKDNNLEKSDDIFFLLYYLFRKKFIVSNANNNNKNSMEFSYKDYPKELSNNILKYLHFSKEIQTSIKLNE